jgi:hypothetical protein
MNRAINSMIIVDWRMNSGVLKLSLSQPVKATWWAKCAARVAVNLDKDDRVLDVDIMGLPPWLLEKFNQYAARPRTSRLETPVSLDWDAGWLWIHHLDGHAARRKRAEALVRFSMNADHLIEVLIKFTTTPSAVQDNS